MVRERKIIPIVKRLKNLLSINKSINPSTIPNKTPMIIDKTMADDMEAGMSFCVISFMVSVFMCRTKDSSKNANTQ